MSFQITFNIHDNDVFDHAVDLHATFTFEDAPEWGRLTQKFQEFLTGYGYRFAGPLTVETNHAEGFKVPKEA